MSENDSLIGEFLIECHENLEKLDRDLVVLEKEPANSDRLAGIFRTIHTIKGTSGFFGFDKLGSVTHVGENLLSLLRDGVLRLTPNMTSVLLAMVDAVREILANIERTQVEGEGDYQALIEELTRLQDPAADASRSARHPVAAETDPGYQTTELEADHPTESKSSAEKAAASRHCREPVETSAETNPVVVAESQSTRPSEAGPSAVAETSIRVDVGLLDKLMNLVGELVLARNQILQFNASQKDPNFLRTTQRLNLITTELQEGVMKTRMQPIGNVWNRFPRIVRDLSLNCGKQVRVEMEGQDTELDKTIIEAIKDPLTHVIRNSVDHGVEPPEIRVAAGKHAEGCIFLRAYHEGGQVNIEISDDGKGIHPEKLKAKAIERGLITREQAARMSDRECIHLIFLAGFSTAEKITSVSGRGVGMDVVKTNIEKIGGTLDIQSQPGIGTTLKIKIPLTLAIIPALIVTSGGDRYAIPQVSLLELVRLEGEQARRGIERIRGTPVYRLRGNLLPLVYLSQELRVEPVKSPKDADAINIVVLQADDRQFGLVIEGINDTEEIVVKPLGKLMKTIPLFAGATIMGDGRVALILDVMGIAQQSGVISEVHDRSRSEQGSRSGDRDGKKQSFLLLGLGRTGRLAVPLSLVARLEEISAESVERSDTQEVVQYRGQIMPLIRLSALLSGNFEFQEGPLKVVVYTQDGRSVGLVVDRILDIVEDAVEISHVSRRPGILGSAVIQQQVTDLLDVRALIQAGAPTLFETSSLA